MRGALLGLSASPTALIPTSSPTRGCCGDGHIDCRRDDGACRDCQHPGASLAAAPVEISGTGGSITVPPVTVSSLSCSPASVGPAGSSACTVNLSAQAGNVGSVVTLTSSTSTLTVPASVTVPPGSMSASFTSTAGSFSSDQTATVTAALNGSSANTSVSLVAPILVSSLQCGISTLTQNQNTSCTVTLSKAAPAGGVTVTLANTTTALIVPASVAVPANATSAAFTVSTATIRSAQTATITATANGSSAKVSVGLVTPVQIDSLSCARASLSPNTATVCTAILTAAAPASGAVLRISLTFAPRRSRPAISAVQRGASLLV